MPFEIPFTFYQLPHGRKSIQMFPTNSEEVFVKAKQIMSAGFLFESEILTTGHAHITITGSNCDAASIIGENNETIIRKIEKMIMSFDIENGKKINQGAA